MSQFFLVSSPISGMLTRDLSLHTFSYLITHALVYTRLTPFVIVHALVVIFFLVLCIGYRRSISDHGGLSSERQIIPCPDCTEPFQITESLEDRVYYAALLHV
jgi:hypothetical protein